MSQSGSPNGTPRSSHDGGASDKARSSLDAVGAGDAENAFQKAIAVWRSIDLSSLQKQLDSEASEIITNQRDDLVERKEVAQKTKDFRKLSDADKLAEYKGLLKAYQQFIDHISNHRKSTESLFLNVYNHLSEAPDPYPLLEATIDSLVQSEDVSRLTSENNSLRTTVSRLTSQNQNLETRIDDLKREASRKDNEGNRALEKAEEGFQAVLEERTANWEAKERSLLEKIEHQERVIKEQKASYEASLRMGKVAEGNDDDVGGASLAELEIVSSDLERTTMRLTEMEHRNEQLRAQLAQALATQNSAGGKSQKEQDELDEEIQRLESVNSNLLKKMDNLKSENEDKFRDYEKKERQLEREVDMIKKERTVLKDKVKAWSDYDEIKRELEVLKTIEFSTGDDDEDGHADEVDVAGQNKKESLEQLLLARNKKLGNELTVLRVSHQDLSSRLSDLQRQLDSTSKDLAESRNLNNQLEDDLQKAQSQTTYANPAMSVAGTYTSRYPASQAGHFGPRGGGRVSPTSSIISGRTGQPSFDQLRAANAEPSSGILPMLTAQRDRYKARSSQLEDELSRTQETVTSLRQEIASLQKDNLQLYEKTRYVSSYGRPGGSNGRTGAVGVHNNPTTSSGLSLDRYRAAYEANLSPFEAFRTRESVRAYHRMGVLERVLFSLTRMVMKNRITRNLFAGYCLFLHLFCIGILYWAGMGETEKYGGVSMSAGETIPGAVGGGSAAGEWKAEEAPNLGP
ncbi:hypothetical protein TWF106_010437 [Orbilia oligospora]|uniref:Protein CASP n=1 Tax=Orbilia oligospora TaxID=2813651 RepID=A0A6G1MAP2_ORBOL|nr:hypothetical protein TWF788_006548 [Orbilia oligospora]KAF3207691.1 hypothetical protein TWF679_008258 [Orbilia oligospora]KAF3210778.1 hypothetical protein TWF106_010437 [Orbilia oligospora]KAF3213556.1 hypothetical protein TWF191_010030 [Orbilia oligospora]KAF3249458.1 hypothetical protein TWF192_005533 [Orbilia oligospora]